MYDPANNWTTIRYGWKAEPTDQFLTGTWDAPQQQLQWWFGKRPLQTAVTKVNTPDPPTPAEFYKTRDTLEPPDDLWEHYSDFEYTCKERDADQADARLGTVYFKDGPGQCAGKVWIPEVIDLTASPQWQFAWAPLGPMRNTYTDVEAYYDTRTECKTWTLGNSTQDVKAAYNLLCSMLLPGGSDITWNYTGPCVHQMPNRDDVWGAWRAFQGPTDDGLGPNAVYQGGSYPGPGPDMRHYIVSGEDPIASDGYGNDFVKTDSQGTPHFLDNINKMSMQQVRLGWFDRNMTAEESKWRFFYGDGDASILTSDHGIIATGSIPHWWMLAWCPPKGALPGSGWQYGVTCTLSVTPTSDDVFADLPGCAQSLPQGIPYITCRAANGTLLSIDSPITPSAFKTIPGPLVCCTGQNNDRPYPDLTPGVSNRTSSNIVAGVNFMLTRQDYNDSLGYDPNVVTLGTQGLLPDIPCNKRAYSARFGGRCAAPVVQYLAYDEAYHLPANAAKYGLPTYGGCLSGGLMRYLGDNSNADWSTYNRWWTPPFWPADAWYNLKATRTEADPGAARDAFLNDQEKLNSLFVYQEQFKVGFLNGPAGERHWGCTCSLCECGSCASTALAVPFQLRKHFCGAQPPHASAAPL